jgi:molybdopterin-guanine dinucleotide biosynthesis protein A
MSPTKAVTRPAGVILAGGRSSRIGVGRKALLELNGRPLLAHVIERLQPQLGSLLLSCESYTDDFDDFGLKIIADILPRHRGPLTGLCSALQHLVANKQDNGLLLCPCDAPFIPLDLVQTLVDADLDGSKPVVVVSYQGVLQPTFSLWHKHHFPVIHEAVVSRGQGGLKHMLHSLPHKIVEWPEAEPSPFFNINTPKELETAATWLD